MCCLPSLYGSRISLFVGFVSVALAMVIGIVIGLISGYFGGMVDAFFMRIADVMLSFPTILVALLISGIARGALPREMHDSAALIVLVFAITITTWVQYARTVRSSTMVERSREYVYAAQLVGRRPFAILFSHILPNVMGPVLVIATINLAMAILIEATLSFSGRRDAAHQPVAWHADPSRQRIPVFGRVVGRDLSVADAGRACAGGELAG